MPVTQEAYTAALSLVAAVAYQMVRPSIFSMEEGGLSFEWVDPNNFFSLEIQADTGLIDAMYLTVPGPANASTSFTHVDGLTVTQTSALITAFLTGELTGGSTIPKEILAGITEKETRK